MCALMHAHVGIYMGLHMHACMWMCARACTVYMHACVSVCVCMCVHVCRCMCAHNCVRAHVCLCVEGPDSKLGCRLPDAHSFPLFLFKTGSFIVLDYVSLGWPVSPKDLLVSASPALGSGVTTMPGLFTWVTGIKLRSSCLEDKCFIA